MSTTEKTTHDTMSHSIKVRRLQNGSHTFEHTVNAEGFTIKQILEQSDRLQKQLTERYPLPDETEADERYKTASLTETEGGEYDLKTRQPIAKRTLFQKTQAISYIQDQAN